MLAFAIILIVIAAALEFFSLREPVSRVKYTVRASARSIDPDEQFEIISTLENLSRLPMPYLRVQENLPPEIHLELGRDTRYKVIAPPDNTHGALRLTSAVYLMPRQRLERRVVGSLPERGRYFLRGASVFGGDFLALSESSASFSCFCELVVLPKRAQDTTALTALGGFLGDISVRRFTMEDPVLTLSFREYTGREPLKQISWKQSLRAGKLMVKEYDHTLEPAVTVLLNVECGALGPDRQLIELSYSLSRTVCETLEARRIKYSFITNATAAGAIGVWSSIGEGLGDAHLYAILEGLGRATYRPLESFSRTTERAVRASEHGRSHIIISAERNDALLEGVSRIKRVTGGEVQLLIAAECVEKPSQPGAESEGA